MKVICQLYSGQEIDISSLSLAFAFALSLSLYLSIYLQNRERENYNHSLRCKMEHQIFVQKSAFLKKFFLSRRKKELKKY